MGYLTPSQVIAAVHFRQPEEFQALKEQHPEGFVPDPA
jgi:hypothetical protein